MLCLLVAAAGCDAAPTRTAAVGGCSPARGDSRLGDALLHVPRTAQAPLPLVVAFHGAGGSAAGFAVESGLSRSADRHGFAVLYPQAGSRRRFWALKRTARPDDVARMRAMLPDAERLVCADSQRVYATGVSNGGGFAARVACEMSDTFAAVAPVAGGYSSLDRCPAGARASVLEIHGSADEIVPYRGRGADHAGDVGAYVAGWARRDGCDARPRIAHPARYVTRLSYPRCDPGYAVEHVRLRGTDHGWPGARSPWPHHDPTGVLAREMVWDFFEGLA
jgi:polyhydroxybutyrate depolymerase